MRCLAGHCYGPDEIPNNPQQQHIQGHQDNATNFAQIPLPAQLNMIANHIVEHMTTPQLRYSQHTLITGTPVQLHLPAGTIMSYLKHANHWLATLPAIQV